MQYNNITTTTENGIQSITINREAKMNALNRETLGEIKAAFEETYNNDAIKGVIITGAGEKAFVAGADISEFLSISPEEGKALARNGHEIFNLIERCPKPVVAAINGFALGGGCELAMACHLRVASDNARFGQPEVKLGLIPGYGGTQRLITYLGRTRALELLMTADMISAEQALELGLVNAVVPQEELLGKAQELLNKIFKVSPIAVGSIIRCANAYFNEAVDGLDFEINEFGNCFGTDDFKEGTSAFLEKRKPMFQ